jgi:hypothetical protein
MRTFLAILVFLGCLLLGSIAGCFAGFLVGGAATNYGDNTLTLGLAGWGLGALLGIGAAVYFIRRMR